jgi:DNA-directed RNA polymerase subunit alpha
MNYANLLMPEKVELDDSSFSTTFGRFILQPLERGFGVTLGNVFRRVLLSSLQGAAITAIRLDGIQHEFSDIPGVKEDVVEIILNLKAGDIGNYTADFEILNPDLHIATLNEDADVELEIRVGKGRGYVPAEENKPLEASIGLIPIDSIFSPIRNVRYQVENVRVGQRTDYEKLVLEIETDGSITPDDALTYAGKILKDHIQMFINFEIEPEEEETQEIDEEILRVKKLLRMSVDELELSVRSHNCLKNANIKNISDLVRLDESELLKFRNFGRKSLQEIQDILEKKGLYFGMDVDKYLKGED